MSLLATASTRTIRSPPRASGDEPGDDEPVVVAARGPPRASGDEPRLGATGGEESHVRPARAGMSLIPIVQANGGVGPPRASGDEPRPTSRRPSRTESAPRERG